jgi:hypothetical protein
VTLRINVKKKMLANAQRYVYYWAMKNKAAVALGKRGGKARAKNMTSAERSESARKAVLVRWAKAKEKQAQG